jgi:hypothetical protein
MNTIGIYAYLYLPLSTGSLRSSLSLSPLSLPLTPTLPISRS